MPMSIVDLTNSWPAAPTHTAAGETGLLLANNNPASPARFWITEDDVQPVVARADAVRIEPGEKLGFTLNDGERLWVRGLEGGKVTMAY